MKFNFDWAGVGYVVQFAVLIAVIFVSWNFAAHQVAYILVSNDIQSAEAEAAEAEFSRATVWRELAKDAVIYSSGDAARAKRDELIRTESNFLMADLTGASITFYQKGVPLKSFSIRAKGKNGSFFETPSGSYRIESREENHFSTIGKVWMPWSMHFFGNYFIAIPQNTAPRVRCG